MSLQENLQNVKARIKAAAERRGRKASDVQLVVVTKEQPVLLIQELYKLGVRDFGENRLHEVVIKQQKLPQDAHWHMIGSIQSNKVSKMGGNFVLIHSIDSFKLAQKLNQMREECDVLLQINTSRESSKHGFLEEEVIGHIRALKQLQYLHIRGLMTMGPLGGSEKEVRACFQKLRTLRDTYLPGGALSMGMSQDFELAIEEGATIVRIGSAIFHQ